MKRTLQMTADDTMYIVNEGEKQLITIKKDKMKVSGFDLYDKIFKDTPKNAILDIDVTGRESLDGKGKIVFDRFKELIDAVAGEINDSFVTTEQTESVSCSEQPSSSPTPQG